MKRIISIIMRALLCMTPIMLARADEDADINLRFKHIDEKGIVTAEVINLSKSKVSFLSPGNSWGDRCYFLIVQNKGDVTTLIRVPEHVYTRNGPGLSSVPGNGVSEIKVHFDKPAAEVLASAINVAIVYSASEFDLSEAGVDNNKAILKMARGMRVKLQ